MAALSCAARVCMSRKWPTRLRTGHHNAPCISLSPSLVHARPYHFCYRLALRLTRGLVHRIRPCQGLRSVPTCRATWTEAGSASGVDGRAVGGAGAALGGVSAEGQDAAPGPAADGGGDRLAARERREVAGGPRPAPAPGGGGPPPPSPV